MLQIWISRSGAPEVLLKRQTNDPTPRANQVIVEAKAIGVNFADVLARSGRYPDAPPLPFVPGFESAGIVRAVGEAVTRFQAGDRVVCAPYFGGYSDVLCVNEDQAVLLPAEMSFEVATALPVQYATAYQLVHETARLREGETVFIHAAAGGVGSALVDLCRKKGARIFGSAGVEKHAWLRDRGVQITLDSRSDSFFEDLKKLARDEPIQVIFDSLGGQSWRVALDCLASLGRLCVYGHSSVMQEDGGSIAPDSKRFGPTGWFQIDFFQLVASNHSVQGVNLATLRKQVKSAVYFDWIAKLFQMYEAKEIHPEIFASYPLQEAAEAHRALQSRKTRGKIVLIP